MKELACPYCGWFENIRVKDRRGVWRRRQCMNPECNERFSTDEVVRPISPDRMHRAIFKGQMSLGF